MEPANKTIQELAKEYLVEWQVGKDYLRKVHRNTKKLTKYVDEAHRRSGADDYGDNLRFVLDMLENLNNLNLKLEMHEKEADRIRCKITKLNPYQKL